MNLKKMKYWQKGIIIGGSIGIVAFIPIIGYIVMFPTIMIFGLSGGDYMTAEDSIRALIFYIVLFGLIGFLYDLKLNKK